MLCLDLLVLQFPFLVGVDPVGLGVWLALKHIGWWLKLAQLTAALAWFCQGFFLPCWSVP